MSDNDRINGWEAGSSRALNGDPMPLILGLACESAVDSLSDWEEGYREGYAEYFGSFQEPRKRTQTWLEHGENGRDYVLMVNGRAVARIVDDQDNHNDPVLAVYDSEGNPVDDRTYSLAKLHPGILDNA